MRVTSFLDIPIAATTADDAVEAVLSAAGSRPTTFRLVNAGTLDAAATRPEYWQLLRGEGVNLPDGRPLSAVLTRINGVDCEQVPGPWLFERCLDLGRERGTRHYLLGATQDTLNSLVAASEAKFPGVRIVGTYSPPFGARSSDELASQDDALTASGADIVWVALGTPKQDSEALRIFRATGVTTAAVGAAFDFTAGTKRRAPELVQRLGLEWLHRLLSEPRRLLRRYVVGNLRFIVLAWRHRRAIRAR